MSTALVAYKLLIYCSHGIDGRPKFIIWTVVGCASNHDNPLAVTAVASLKSMMIRKAFSLGDHAFHGCFGIVVLYHHLQMIGASAIPMATFNHSHSSDRMTSEHGVVYMKLWGVTRGRSEMRFYEKEDFIGGMSKYVSMRFFVNLN